VGVAFSQEKDIKKLIMSKIKPKKMQSQVNFTEYSQLCEGAWQFEADILCSYLGH